MKLRDAVTLSGVDVTRTTKTVQARIELYADCDLRVYRVSLSEPNARLGALEESSRAEFERLAVSAMVSPNPPDVLHYFEAIP